MIEVDESNFTILPSIIREIMILEGELDLIHDNNKK